MRGIFRGAERVFCTTAAGDDFAAETLDFLAAAFVENFRSRGGSTAFCRTLCANEKLTSLVWLWFDVPDDSWTLSNPSNSIAGSASANANEEPFSIGLREDLASYIQAFG